MLLNLLFAHIDLPCDAGGDQCGAALLQQVDGALCFGGESIEFIGFDFEILDDCLLF